MKLGKVSSKKVLILFCFRVEGSRPRAKASCSATKFLLSLRRSLRRAEQSFLMGLLVKCSNQLRCYELLSCQCFSVLYALKIYSSIAIMVKSCFSLTFFGLNSQGISFAVNFGI